MTSLAETIQLASLCGLAAPLALQHGLETFGTEFRGRR